MRLHPHGLSASQSPHLLMSHWMLGFQLRDLGRTQIIRLQKHLFILLLHAPIILQSLEPGLDSHNWTSVTSIDVQVLLRNSHLSWLFRNSELHLCCNRKPASTINIMLITNRWNFFSFWLIASTTTISLGPCSYFFRAMQLFLMQSLLPLFMVCTDKLLMSRFWKSYIS